MDAGLYTEMSLGRARWQSRWALAGVIVGSVGAVVVASASRADEPASAVAGASGIKAAPGPAPAKGLTPLGQWSREKARQGAKATRGTGADALPGGLGGVPTDEALFTRHRSFIVKRGTRPERVLLTEFLPPVASQGSQQSCVAWSASYYGYSYAVARSRRLTPEQRAEERFKFSPAFVYNQINDGRDAGSQVGRAFEVMRDLGAASLAEMPYDPADYKTRPNETARERAARFRARKVAFLFKGRSFYWGGAPADIDAAKTFLSSAQQPFTMAIPIFKDFPAGSVAADYIYTLSQEPSKENFRGLHAVTCVGYDDSLKAFRIVNSWGPRWGDNGFLWLDQEFVRLWGGDAWAVAEPGGPKGRASLGRLVSLSAEPKAVRATSAKPKANAILKARPSTAPKGARR
jgi:hypothetical protein